MQLLQHSDDTAACLPPHYSSREAANATVYEWESQFEPLLERHVIVGSRSITALQIMGRSLHC